MDIGNETLDGAKSIKNNGHYWTILNLRRVFDDVNFGGAQIDMGSTEFWA